MRHLTRALAAGALFACALSAAQPAAAQSGKDFFKGKTIEWIIGTEPGGGHDFYARLISGHVERFLPGSTIVPKNRPGAGHIIAANLIYAARPNGLTIGSFSTGLVYSQILQKNGVRFDLGKMSWIGKADADVRVLSAAATSEYKTFEDVLNTKREIKFSASGVGAGSYNDAFLTATAFGIPFRIIPGYSGGDTVLGLMRGETDLLMGGQSSAEEYVRSGHAKILMQYGTFYKDIPNAADYAKTADAKAVVKLMIAQGNLARVTAGPPDIPADRLEALRTAYREAVESKEIREQAAKAKRDFHPAYGEEVTQMIRAALEQPPAVVAMLRKLEEAAGIVVKHTGPLTQIKNGGRELVINYQGQEVSAKVSGSRTEVMVGGQKAKRDAIQMGMTCTFTYTAPGQEAKQVDCK